MHSSDPIPALLEDGFLKEHPKEVFQAEKLLIRAFREWKEAEEALKTAENFVQQILKQVHKEEPQLELEL